MNFRVLKNGRGSFIQFQAFRATPADIRKHRDEIWAAVKATAIKPHEITVLRTRLGKTQRQLAQILRVNVTSVSRWERGVQVPLEKYAVDMRRLANG